MAAIPEVKIGTTAEMFGLDTGTKVLESRIPVTQDPLIAMGDVVNNWHDEIARGATEAVGNPSTEMAIVANPVDEDFKRYTEEKWGRKIDVAPVDLHTFDPETMTEIMRRLNENGDVKHYGMYAVRYLPGEHTVITPAAYDFFNAKGQLTRVVPADAVPRHRLLVDPKAKQKYEGIETAQPFDTFTQNDFELLVNGGDFAVAKAADWGMGGDGVWRVRDLRDIEKCRDYLRQQGVSDPTIILEEPLDVNTGGSFSLIKNRKGEVRLLGVTEQLSTPDGLRLGNIIYDQSKASLDMLELIEHIRVGLEKNPLADGVMGYFAFDTMRDKSGKPVVNDPAQRMTGSTPVAQMRQRIALFEEQSGRNGKDLVAGMAQPLLAPGTTFNQMHEVLERAQLTGANGRVDQVVVRSFYNRDGGKSVAQFAVLTDDRDRLPSVTKEIAESLTNAGIFQRWYEK